MIHRSRNASSPPIERTRAVLSPAAVDIWNTTRRIPRGCVSTYGSIAALAGFKGQARLAGYALHNLPPGIDVPWQRVINARGMISLCGRAGELQRVLLEQEGVVFRRKRVDLALCGWPRMLRKGRPRRSGRSARHESGKDVL